LALTPSSILRMPDGDVKVRGLATDAALTDADRVSDEQASRVDAVGLVRIIYAGLTGRWPMAGGSGRGGRPVGLDPAPTTIAGVAAPSEIAVGVPNDLDLICRMTLNDDRGPVSPGDLAMQIAPWASDQPVSDGGSGIDLPVPRGGDITPTRVMPAVAPRYSAPAGARSSGDLYDRLAGASSGQEGRPTGTGRAAATSGVGAVGARARDVGTSAEGRGGARGMGTDAAAGPSAASAGPAGAAGATSAGAALAAAGAAAAGVAGSIGDRVGSFARAAADKAATKAAERRSAHHAPFDGEEIALSEALEDAPTTRLAPPVPVFGGGPERPSGAQSRIALAIVGALVLVALAIGINNVAKIGDSDSPADARPTVTVTRTRATATTGTTTNEPAPTTTTQAPPSAEPVSIVGGSSFDPEDDGEESPSLVPLAFDGDPSTAWKSRWYGSDTYNRSKEGVGLVLDLSSATVVREVELTLPAAQDVSLYLSDAASLDGAQQIGRVKDTSGTVTVKAPAGINPGTKLIVWVTRPAPDEAPNHHRAQIAEVVVR
jgi:hypothetical protein